MKTGTEGLKLIKSFEGCKLTAYKCPAGVWTIGYGHTGKMCGKHIVEGMSISQYKATKLLKEDMKRFEDSINKYVKVKLKQNQYDALVSFVYNVGIGNFTRSTLLKKLNNEDYQGAAEQFLRWNKANGVVLEGLMRRRIAEKELFVVE